MSWRFIKSWFVEPTCEPVSLVDVFKVRRKSGGGVEMRRLGTVSLKMSELMAALQPMAERIAEELYVENGVATVLSDVQNALSRREVRRAINDFTNTLEDDGIAELYFLKVYIDKMNELVNTTRDWTSKGFQIPC
jgi:hypothetical protein